MNGIQPGRRHALKAIAEVGRRTTVRQRDDIRSSANPLRRNIRRSGGQATGRGVDVPGTGHAHSIEWVKVMSAVAVAAGQAFR